MSIAGWILTFVGLQASNVYGHGHSALQSDISSHGHFHGGTAASVYIPSFISIWSLNLQNYLNQYVFTRSNSYNSIISTIIIQLVPLMAILFLTSLNFNLNSPLINKILIPFAFGTLLGDILLHLLPECVNDNMEMNSIGIFVGILLFTSIDKIIKILTNSNDLSHHSHSHAHPHSHSHSHSNSHTLAEKVESKKFNASIILNVITGLLHNITDGITIASSFYSSKQMGIITTVAMIFHETPHQLGDFIMLFSNGLPLRSCLFTQLLNILCSIIGTVIGCYINEVGNIDFLPWGHDSHSHASEHSLMLPVITGGLIYTAMVSILPEFISSSNDTNIIDSRRKKLFDFSLQLCSIILGFTILAIM